MGTKGVLRSMSERDPFLHDNLQKREYQENIHQAYLQLSHTITSLLKPPTPEIEEEASTLSSNASSKKKKKRRKPRMNSSTSSVLSKYCNPPGISLQVPGTPSSRPQSNRSRRSNRSRLSNATKSDMREFRKSKNRLEVAATPNPAPSVIEPDRVKYSIRYSKVLDIFKRKIYRDIIKTLGIDINNLDDPTHVEIDLAWCKVGSFILDSRENTYLSFQQFVDETASMYSARDMDESSMYSGFSSFLPPIHKASSVRSKSPFNGSVASERKTPKTPKKKFSSEEKTSKVPKLPVIGEHNVH